MDKINPNLDLTKLAVKNIKYELGDISIDKIIKLFPKKEFNILIISSLLFISIMLIPRMNQSTSRVINYKTEFNPPTPFKIVDISKDNSALSGDTINLEFNIIGGYPDSIKLYLKTTDDIQIQNIGNINNKFNYTINNIKSEILYWTKYDSYSLFSSWDTIGTLPQKILVKKRERKIRIIIY